MLNNIALPGMKVVMNLDAETRSWRGKNAPANGTVGVLTHRNRDIFFRERFGNSMNFYVPGVYAEDTSWNVLWEGTCKLQSINSTDVEIHKDDKKRYDERAEDMWYAPVMRNHTVSFTQRENELNNSDRVTDLPETKFYERDVIVTETERFHADNEGYEFIAARVNYSFSCHMQADDDDRGQLYDGTWIDPKTGEYARRGSLIGVCDRDYNLVKRGNVWKYFHGEKLKFRSLREEISFYAGLGDMQEVRNPASDHYQWTLDEFKQAVKADIIDGMTAGGLLLPSDNINAYRFKNRDLGERVRQETMKGFDI